MNWVNATRPSAVAGRIADYGEFLETKRLTVQSDGVDVEPEQLCPALFAFQRDLTRWALRKGRSAVFADTGLGKTLIQLAWAEHAAERTLILAPLAVAQQTVLEGARWGISVTYARSQSQAAQRGITITNYEMLDHFHASAFGAVVLDESSCLKAYDGKTRTKLIRAFANTPMRLCCTATPAPNDIAEIANHAEFLGILTRAEMLATFFVHDENGWRLKGHAREPFYRWLASWGMSLKKPSDLGYADEGYDLPPLTITPIIVPTEWAPPGQMFPTTLKGITERSAVRKDTLAARVEAAVELVKAEPDEQWLLWCGLNDEGRELKAGLPEATLVEGADRLEDKAQRLMAFAAGEERILISKVSIAGFGLNLQRCARMAFVGLSDSYEAYYQAVRRCWRYGQTRSVHAYIVLTEPEEPVYQNVLRKEREAETMAAELLKHVRVFEQAEIAEAHQRIDYAPLRRMEIPSWVA